MKNIFLSLFIFSSVGYASDNDFFVFHSDLTPGILSTVVDCRENIAKVICLVSDLPNESVRPEDRKCLQGGERYSIYLEQLYDNYPPAMQKMFCSLRYIFIEQSNMGGTAYAGLVKDSNKKVLGAMMGIRQSVLDENLDLQTWATWKEQLSFGGAMNSYQPTPGLPVVNTNSKPGVSDFIYFVITHEFGHIFDFANDLNARVNCEGFAPGSDTDCLMAPNSWGAISWISENRPKPENDFPLRNLVCFYWCNGKPLGLSQVLEVFSSLAKTSFISNYATRQPWDDFADSLAYYLLDQNLAATYQIDTAQGEVYDIMQKLKSPIFAEKREYIRSFLDRADIVYP